MKRIVFITGTDTSVGKTEISACVLAAYRIRGVDARYFKPIQSGAMPGRGDPDAVQSAFRLNQGAVYPCLYSFRAAASPHLCSETEGVRISIHRIMRCIDCYVRECDVLVVEGAGGLLVPLTRNATILDLIKKLDCQPVLVSRNTLGTLNHTALSVREMQRSGCPPAVIVLNSITKECAGTDRLVRRSNLETIRRSPGRARVIDVPYTNARRKEARLTAGLAIIDSLA